MTWQIIFICLFIFVPVSFIMVFIPYLTRRTESFGISVTEEIYDSPNMKTLRKQYAIWSALICLFITVSAIVWSFFLTEEQWMIAFLIHVLGLLLLTFIVYLKHHVTVKKWKHEQKWHEPPVIQQTVIDTQFHQRKSTVSYWWYVPHIILILITFGIWVFFYDQFPDHIALQYDLNGNPTRVIDKSVHAVLYIVAIQCFLLALFMFVNFSISRSKQQIDVSNPEASIQRNVIFRRRWSQFLAFSGFMIIGLFTMMQFSMLFEFHHTVQMAIPFVVTGIILIGAIWLSWVTGQGGSRIKINGKTLDPNKVNTDDDRYWKLGQFYFNPKDPSLFLEKRFGIGWTMNFGHPLAWIILIGIIAIPILLVLILP